MSPLLTRKVSLRRIARWQVVAWSAAAPEPALLHGVLGGLHAVAVSAAHQARDVFQNRASCVSELPQHLSVRWQAGRLALGQMTYWPNCSMPKLEP